VDFLFETWQKAWELEKEERNLLARPVALFFCDYFNSKTGEAVVELERYLPFGEESKIKIPLSRHNAAWVWEVIKSKSLHPKWIGVLAEEMVFIQLLAEGKN